MPGWQWRQAALLCPHAGTASDSVSTIWGLSEWLRFEGSVDATMGLVVLGMSEGVLRVVVVQPQCYVLNTHAPGVVLTK